MISDRLKQIYAGSNELRYLETLEFSHPQFSQVYYTVNDYKEWTFRLSSGDFTPTIFLPVPFTVKLPNKDAQGNQEMEIALCNVGRELVEELEASMADTSQGISTVYRVYLNHPDLNDRIPETDPALSLSITNISMTNEVVTATATRFDILNRSFPDRIYTLDEFPGLRR